MAREYPAHNVAEHYLQALGSHDPIDSLRKAPKRLRKLIGKLSKKQLARRPAEGKWSIKDVLAHLADGEMVLGTRMRFVAAMDRPAIVGYDQDAFVANLAYDDTSADELWRNFAQLRAMNVALLERLPERAFARVGLHSERGEESLVSMVFMYAGHDRLHEAQIVRLVEGLRTAKSARDAGRAKPRRKKP